MSVKGDRSRVTDHEAFSRSIERIRRNEARKRKQEDKNKKSRGVDTPRLWLYEEEEEDQQ